MSFWKTANTTPYTAMNAPMNAINSVPGCARARR